MVVGSQKNPTEQRVQKKRKQTPQKQQSRLHKQKNIYHLYEQALKLLFQSKYKPARDLFLKLKDTFPEQIDVLARVNSFLAVCDSRLHDQEEKPPSNAEDFFDLGVVNHNLESYEVAKNCFTQALKLEKKDSDYIYYALAATEVCLGNSEKALRHLAKAIEIKEDNRFFAGNDPDFGSLEKNEEFQDLVRSQRNLEECDDNR